MIRFCRWTVIGLLLGSVGLWGAGPISAQPTPDSLLTIEHVRPLAAFDEATALAIDPSGRLYVTDAGQDAVVQLTAEGAVETRHGGPGAQPGAFDDPVAFDPTNGLALYVADAGNARIQRFARSFQFLEALPVGTPSEGLAGPTYESRSPNPVDSGTGEPIDVAVSRSGEVYIVDAANRHVLAWDAQRRTPGVIGGFEAGAGALDDPVSLALGPDDRLFVADRGRNAIVVFDAFGNYITTYAEGLAAEAESLRIVDGALWLIMPDSIQQVSLSGRLGPRWAVRLEAPLVDAARHDGAWYLLTPDRLYRVADW